MGMFIFNDFSRLALRTIALHKLNLINLFELYYHYASRTTFQLCQKNKDIRFERNAKGDLIIVRLMGGKTGIINAEFSTNLVI